MRTVRVALVEDSPVFRSALRSLLSGCGLSITLSNGTAPCDKSSFPVDAVLVDAGTFAKGAEALEELIREYSRLAPVLLLTREDRLEMLLAGLKGGAVGFVEQSASIKELQKAILAVAEGNTWCDAKSFQKVMSFLPSLSYSKELKLTQREEEVLSQVSQGQSNKEIAAHLGLSPQSVKVYVSNLLRKSGVSNRCGLAHYAVVRTLARINAPPQGSVKASNPHASSQSATLAKSCGFAQRSTPGANHVQAGSSGCGADGARLRRWADERIR